MFDCVFFLLPLAILCVSVCVCLCNVLWRTCMKLKDTRRKGVWINESISHGGSENANETYRYNNRNSNRIKLILCWSPKCIAPHPANNSDSLECCVQSCSSCGRPLKLAQLSFIQLWLRDRSSTLKEYSIMSFRQDASNERRGTPECHVSPVKSLNTSRN